MSDQFLFVYGTLRRKYNHPASTYLNKFGRFITDASMRGDLFEIAGYPGAVESHQSHHHVFGELYAIEDVHRLFASLDEYEECSERYPPPHEYCRKKINITTAAGENVMAWTYLYCRPTHKLQKIPSGDYLQYADLFKS